MNTSTQQRPQFASGRRPEIKVALIEQGIPEDIPQGRSNIGFVLICLKGSAIIEHLHTQYNVGHNHIVVVFPGDLFNIIDISHDFTSTWFSFSHDIFDEIFYNFPSSFFAHMESHPTYYLSDSEEYTINTEYIRTLHSKISQTNNICCYEIVLNILRNFFMELYDRVLRHGYIDTSQSKYQRRILDNFVKLMEQHPDCRTVSFFAEQLCITPKHLSTIIHKGTGLTAKEFIDRSCIMEIKHILRTSGKSVSQIADLLGFPTTGNLCRYYKTHTGETLSEYKQTVK